LKSEPDGGREVTEVNIHISSIRIHAICNLGSLNVGKTILCRNTAQTAWTGRTEFSAPAAAGGALSRDTSSGNVSRGDAAPENASPKDTTPANTSRGDAAPEDAVPKDANPANASRGNAAPENATTGKAAPGDAGSQPGEGEHVPNG